MTALTDVIGTDESALELRCPACGNDGSRGTIRYLVQVVQWAEVVALRRGDVLELAGPLTRSMRDEPARARLECWAVDEKERVCGRRFELPAGLRGIAWRVDS